MLQETLITSTWTDYFDNSIGSQYNKLSCCTNTDWSLLTSTIEHNHQFARWKTCWRKHFLDYIDEVYFLQCIWSFSFCVWAMVILCNPLSQICLGCKKESHYLSPTKIVFPFPRRKEAIRIVSVGYWMTILNVERMSVKSMQRTYVAFCISLLC